MSGVSDLLAASVSFPKLWKCEIFDYDIGSFLFAMCKRMLARFWSLHVEAHLGHYPN